MKNIAIVTGASSGFGKEFVNLLNNYINIDEIWCISRNINNLNKLIYEFGNKIKIFPYDLTQITSINELKKLINDSDINIKYLINNAGFAKFCKYDDLSLEESKNLIDLNINSLISMCLICIPKMKENSHILNISSQASFLLLPYQNLYSASKSFVRYYSRSLSTELKDKKIYVTTVCPGWMETNLYNRANVQNSTKKTTKFVHMKDPKKVAYKALKDANKNREMSTYGWYVKLTHLLSKILPLRFLRYIWLKQQKIK